MTGASWFLPAMVAVLLWGVSMFLPKLAIRTLPPFHLIIYHYSFFMAACVVMQFFYGFDLAADARGIGLSLAVGVVGGLAQVLYLISMTYCVVLTSLYPVVATLLAFFFLHETLAPRQAAGIVLGIVSLILMVKASNGTVKTP
jgi:transporter family protein